ncbi:C39 family peptidase [uncultured Thermanaerothrix sp.]|uniref:C39 family peptidase n=1 Tax=uncultured Thermanaerothrix sp. TaxID=1195149 RepID=UPI002604AC7F|nr:C39 family peptidase [uncultured Thermanaerothrix sp.]
MLRTRKHSDTHLLRWGGRFLLGVLVAVPALLTLTLLSPSLRSRLIWRYEVITTYLRGMVDPVKPLPTPRVRVLSTTPTPYPSPSAQSNPTPTLLVSLPSPTPTPTPLPGRVELPVPPYEKQDINNCGPATLAMLLRFYGWNGNQNDIAVVIKPIPQDRNVNIEELLYFTRNYVGWLRSEFRVGGDLALLKRILAAGFPVVIEEGYLMEESYWPNDDRWAGHYLLLTGYDDGEGYFIAQDSFYGPNRLIPYAGLDQNWQAFNRVYFLVFPPESEETLRVLLGEDWDIATNRRHALETAQRETQEQPENAFAWFNLGTNLVYFERYNEAAAAYDQARMLGLPQRMLRYQFGPFFAYFHTHRIDDLMTLTEYALKRTPNSEEALLWRGWGFYRQGKKNEAIASFEEALKAHPGYPDAEYALRFVQQN